MLPFGYITRSHGISFRCDADDTLIYLPDIPPTDLMSHVVKCLEDESLDVHTFNKIKLCHWSDLHANMESYVGDCAC